MRASAPLLRSSCQSVPQWITNFGTEALGGRREAHGVADLGGVGDDRFAQFRKAEEFTEQAPAVTQRRLRAAGIEPKPHQPHELARFPRE